MPDAHDALLTGIGFAHDVLKDVFFGSETTVLLLKASTDEERDFVEVWQITDKWFFEYSDFRQNFLLEIAEDGMNLTDPINEATHIQIDDDVYVIVKGDTREPKGMDVTWKLYCEKFAKRSHYAPVY